MTGSIEAVPVQVADDVYVGYGPDVNWVLLRDGQDLTLIDAGYPGDSSRVEASIRALGHRPEDVRAILLTHAHVDHLGAVGPFHRAHGTPLFTDPVEVPHARREHLEQAAPVDVLKNLWRPGALGWTTRIIRNGATADVTARHAQPFPVGPGKPLDLPGAPVPLPTHAHTSGHTAFHLPAVGVLVTGDELVTGHALSRTDGPQLLPGMFSHATAEAVEGALAALAATGAATLVPGHGRVHHGPVVEAVARARG